MISKSDLIILVLASSALSVGIYRWHQNTQAVDAITVPASSQIGAAPNNGSVTTASLNSNANGTDSKAEYIKPVTVQTINAIEVDEPLASDKTTALIDNNEDQEQFGTHLVRSGDYLGKIAQRYETDVQTLRRINNISGSTILIGQEIRYPIQN